VTAREDRGSKARRRVARTVVATYHEAELAGLVEHVAEAIERYRAGELDVHDVDDVIHRYHKATQELCGPPPVRWTRRTTPGSVESSTKAGAFQGVVGDGIWWAR
jgi:hypothetical protein